MSKFWLLKTLRKFKFLKNRRIDFELEVNSTPFIVPLIAEIGFHNYEMKEFWMLDIFKAVIKGDNDMLIDVGANTGQTLLKWKSVNRLAPYYGFEPIPQCAEYLNELARSNNFENTHIIQKALFDKEGQMELYYHSEDETDRTASLIKSHDVNRRSESVETIVFDNFIKSYDIDKTNIKVVKIDVEGAELEVLNNLFEFLKDQKPTIILEVLAYAPKVDSERLKLVMNLLDQLPHQLHRIKKKGMNFNGLEKIDTIAEGTPKGQSDYLLTPPGISMNL